MLSKEIADELTAKEKREICLEYAQLKTLETAVKNRLDEVKALTNEIIQDDFLNEGIEKRVARIGNTIVGTLTIVKDKQCYVITDPDAFIEWLETYDLGSCTHKANVKASDEIYDMLRNHYSAEEIEHLFFKEPVVYKETEKRILACEDVCLLEGMPSVIPGIVPNPNRFKYVRVTDTNLTTCLNSLGASSDGVLKLLSDATQEE